MHFSHQAPPTESSLRCWGTDIPFSFLLQPWLHLRREVIIQEAELEPSSVNPACALLQTP